LQSVAPPWSASDLVGSRIRRQSPGTPAVVAGGGRLSRPAKTVKSAAGRDLSVSSRVEGVADPQVDGQAEQRPTFCGQVHADPVSSRLGERAWRLVAAVLFSVKIHL
jgi:hypothetical protein